MNMKSVIYSWLVLFLITCAGQAANTHQLPRPEKLIVKSWYKKMAELELEDTEPLKYMQMDVNFDGEPEIIVLGRGGYGPQAILVFKPSADSLMCINELIDGYDDIGYAPGGFEFKIHDNHDGPEERHISTYFNRFVNGEMVLNGVSVMTIRCGEEENDVSYDCSIVDRVIPWEKYRCLVPEPKNRLYELAGNSKNWKSFTVSTARPK